MSSFLFDIDKLARQLGLDHLPKERQEDFLGRLEEIISSRINVAVLEKLEEDEREHFINLLNNNNDEDALSYVQNKILDLEHLIKDISAKTLDEFVSLKNKSQNQD